MSRGAGRGFGRTSLKPSQLRDTDTWSRSKIKQRLPGSQRNVLQSEPRPTETESIKTNYETKKTPPMRGGNRKETKKLRRSAESWDCSCSTKVCCSRKRAGCSHPSGKHVCREVDSNCTTLQCCGGTARPNNGDLRVSEAEANEGVAACTDIEAEEASVEPNKLVVWPEPKLISNAATLEPELTPKTTAWFPELMLTTSANVRESVPASFQK